MPCMPNDCWTLWTRPELGSDTWRWKARAEKKNMSYVDISLKQYPPSPHTPMRSTTMIQTTRIQVERVHDELQSLMQCQYS